MNLYNLIELKTFNLFPEYFLGISALYMLIVIVLISYNVFGLIINRSISDCIGLIMLLACYLIINDDLLFCSTDFGIYRPLGFYKSVVTDFFGFFTKFIVCFFSSIYFFVIADYLKDYKLTSFEYLLILLFAVLGLLLLCTCNDLLSAYLAIELVSLSSYILASFKKNSIYSVESGIKYLIIGSISSAFFLLGTSFIYSSLGTIFINDFWSLFIDVDYVLLDCLGPAVEYLNSCLQGESSVSWEAYNMLDYYLELYCGEKELEAFGLSMKKILEVDYILLDCLGPTMEYLNYYSFNVCLQIKNPISWEAYNLLDYDEQLSSVEKTLEALDLRMREILEFDLNYFERVGPTVEYLNSGCQSQSVMSWAAYNVLEYADQLYNGEKVLEAFGLSMKKILEFDYVLLDCLGPTTEYLKNYYSCNNFLQIKNPISWEAYNLLDYDEQLYFVEKTLEAFDLRMREILKFEYSSFEYLPPTKEYFEYLNTKNLISQDDRYFFFYKQFLENGLGNLCAIIEDLEFLEPFIEIGLTFIIFSLFIKLALAPFHLWSLDVYEGSPSISTFFFAVITKLSLFVFLTRICYSTIYFKESWQFYAIIVSLLSVFVGSFGGLRQKKLKTLLAYSSVSHMGYVLLSFSTGSRLGIEMLLFYLVIYMLSGIAIWFIVLSVRENKKYYSNKFNKELGDFVLLRKSNPALAISMSVAMFSIAGIPPFIGFFAKLGIFLSILSVEYYIVALLAVLCSVVSTFYYIRIIKILYFENVLVGKLYYPIKTNKIIFFTASVFALFFLFLNPTLMYLIIHNVVWKSLPIFV